MTAIAALIALAGYGAVMTAAVAGLVVLHGGVVRRLRGANRQLRAANAKLRDALGLHERLTSDAELTVPDIVPELGEEL